MKQLPRRTWLAARLCAPLAACGPCGRWSVIAAQELVAAGYTNVWHLDGGMVAWYANGLSLQDNWRTADQP